MGSNFFNKRKTHLLLVIFSLIVNHSLAYLFPITPKHLRKLEEGIDYEQFHYVKPVAVEDLDSTCDSTIFSKTQGSCVCDPPFDGNLGNNRTFVNSVCLDPVFSDTKNGYVVVEVKFTIVNTTVVLQIKEGRLFDDIIRHDTRWVDPKPCKHIEKIDFTQRSFFTDDIFVNETYVVTGIGLKKCPEKLDTKDGEECAYKNMFHLTLYQRPTIMGNLSTKAQDELIISKSLSNPERTQILLEVYDLESLGKLDRFGKELSVQGEQYVTFEIWHSEDDTYPLVPYIDLVEADILPSSPLVGVGLIYKGISDSDYGFLSFKFYVEA